MESSTYDIIVVGAGHAGVEAALACSRMEKKTLLITSRLDKIAFMSCNPSVGGLGKGHIVREIDVFGGVMPLAADATCIQFKRLNASKGPAVRGSRAQCDKDLYSNFVTEAVKQAPFLDLKEGEVKKLIIKNSECLGIQMEDGSVVSSKCTILTTGTFMRGVMHVGSSQTPGGRVGEKPSVGLSDQLGDLGFRVTRLKTGTPPRLKKQSIDWDRLSPQWGDSSFSPFSLRSSRQLKLPQVPCHLTFTTPETHDIIEKNLYQSPLFSGAIEGVGPRYCPSIEDKITRFPDRTRHQSFLEPEGLSTDSIYLQGISTSLPAEVQRQFLVTIPGLERVEILRPGYAVEYDFFEPTQIWPTLETKDVKSLFFAGQINGTSGYEEAACQGLMAGLNAALKIANQGDLVLGREEAYIGVLIDDLVTKGTKEPYRMMTSRAEHRLVLREDNTLERLADRAFKVGAISENLYRSMEEICQKRRDFRNLIRSKQIVPDEKTQTILKEIPTAVLQKPINLETLLRRNEIRWFDLKRFGLEFDENDTVQDPVEIEVKYEGYISRQNELIDRMKKFENMKLPQNLCYNKVRGLSSEEVEKLGKIQPRTLGQVQRISGVNPSAVQALLIHLKGHGLSGT